MDTKLLDKVLKEEANYLNKQQTIQIMGIVELLILIILNLVVVNVSIYSMLFWYVLLCIITVILMELVSKIFYFKITSVPFELQNIDKTFWINVFPTKVETQEYSVLSTVAIDNNIKIIVPQKKFKISLDDIDLENYTKEGNLTLVEKSLSIDMENEEVKNYLKALKGKTTEKELKKIIEILLESKSNKSYSFKLGKTTNKEVSDE